MVEEQHADFDEMVEYWRIQNTFKLCDACPNLPRCWKISKAVYRPEVMLKICGNKKLLKALRRLLQMKEDKPIDYFAITGRWFSDERFWRMIEKSMTHESTTHG